MNGAGKNEAGLNGAGMDGAGLTDEEIGHLLEKLDLGQKARLLTGASNWRTYAEPAIGLRALTFSDGPAGVRGDAWDERDTSLVLPSPTALAAAWDDELAAELGGLLATEARRKGVDVLLAPTLNLHRSPLGGRHFECFSEDPLLTGRTGAALIGGVQSGGVAATAKHFVANDAETDRLTVDVRVDEQTLREVYLAPFEAAVEAGVRVVMSAYNQVNGVTMAAAPLLERPLKSEWGFDGPVVSDWGAVRSLLDTARAAQDLAMPGPGGPWADGLRAAVEQGLVPMERIDDKVRRLLRLADRVGALGDPPRVRRPTDPPTAAPGAPPRALLRRAVAAGTVLLRNDGELLPLDPARLRSVAVIGAHAAAVRIQGGGSAEVFPASLVSPLDGIRAALAGTAEVTYSPGLPPSALPRPLDPVRTDGPPTRDPVSGEPGVLVRLLDADGAELHAEHRLSGRIVEPARVAGAETVEIRALIRPRQEGEWTLAVGGWGPLSLAVAGRTLLSGTFPLDSDDPTRVHVAPPYRSVRTALAAGEEVEVVARRGLAPGTGVATILAAAPPPGDAATALASAVAAARDADAAVVVVGTTEESESEGRDRDTLGLPDGQDALIRAVVRANPRTVVILNTGGPVALPWRAEVPALLLAWFPGQEAGDGLADVLFGRAEPGGRLPTTWAAAEEDVPVLRIRPERGRLHYAEGPFIGYRAWLRSGTSPAYWFGHGLGYTGWSYGAMEAPSEVIAGRPFDVRIRLRNTGPRRGREVVQLYAAGTSLTGEPPVRRLVGYAAVVADPGEEVVAVVRVDGRATERWSVERHRWETVPGELLLRGGRSAGDLPLSAVITVSGPPGRSPGAATESALR
ncbi:glycoside hydrolase family 3 C-terminal domain-containing protein [Streptomyces scopuliridis]|uniref:glycoside hydrolase family 3 C-terminal domain-containing protein n=1 Tax=Streptomyces scopuliridis TaxID=452529 RepID=UPI002DD8AD81|nr:glycoside hydrolase family 3 C-terminal domain-containing protein [Streptomyces scopuliridis]WSB37689.1 glycoside hydrolase family 3 C-terminal domain-containing protein [Streptomyces scopuliridis]